MRISSFFPETQPAQAFDERRAELQYHFELAFFQSLREALITQT